MIFRLISCQLGASESWLWLTYHHVHLWHSFTYINPHVISFSSPILNSGARDNIFYIKHYVSLNIRLPTSAAWHQLNPFRRTLSISIIYSLLCTVASASADKLYTHIMDSGRRSNCTQCPRSRILAGMPYIFAGGQSGASVRMSNNLHFYI